VRGLVRTLSLVLALAVIAGCARAPLLREGDLQLLAAQAERERALALQRDWGLSGRVAVSGGGDGGSGRIEWRQQGEAFSVSLSAPVSRQSWRLTGGVGTARLEGVEHGPLQGSDPEALLAEAAGWSMPLAQLRAWLRGARADGESQLEFDADGLPARLRQHGWQIEYRGWDQRSQPPLPLRVFAESGERRVRLVVDRWEPHGG
jgi:outer membrane lipoprotein LolB